MSGSTALGVDLAPRMARLIVVTVFGAFASVYVVAAIGGLDEGLRPAGSLVVTVAVFGCQLAPPAPSRCSPRSCG